ncbi:hypothetical protein OO007_01930 [Cocleimonas sp. KMM 6892]|uniref:hypothetical protein n=1 Tax=unclassified Cocleimonas TaxID=2639732 RepID=UPI002DB787C5|nr:MULTISPECIES: hypothetical protein [unclassified Cocleimonas]MEB8430968.1 hypothetical protein [Cocleimonas sp. KMM 6892]MEC4714260.1 hypothetical protein [Cocleimonas sp. KMM 6895]MEC4743591.1 hypothetical protein [Cocleimonas sp. KMM 6896]
MNDAKKGALTAVVATVVTSVMILMTGTGNADNKQSTLEKNQSISVNETTVEILVKEDSPKDEATIELTESIEASVAADAKSTLKSSVLPPPGPFSKSTAGTLNKPQAPQLSPQPEAPKAPESLIEKPVQTEKAPVAPKLDNSSMKKPEIKAPAKSTAEVTAKKPVKPFAPEIRSLKPELKKTPQLPSNKLTAKLQKPKMPVAPEGNNLKKESPKTQLNGQPIWMQMPGNPNGVRYMQQYRYVPMPVYPNYHFPQQPQLNGSYYFAPIPNQWGQQGMKLPSQNKAMKKDHSELENKELEGQSK